MPSLMAARFKRVAERGFQLVAVVGLFRGTAYVGLVDPFAIDLDGQRADDGAAG